MSNVEREAVRQAVELLSGVLQVAGEHYDELALVLNAAEAYVEGVEMERLPWVWSGEEGRSIAIERGTQALHSLALKKEAAHCLDPELCLCRVRAETVLAAAEVR